MMKFVIKCSVQLREEVLLDLLYVASTHANCVFILCAKLMMVELFVCLYCECVCCVRVCT